MTPLALSQGEGPGVRVSPSRSSLPASGEAQTLSSITDDLARAAQALTQRATYNEACAYLDNNPTIRLNLAKDDRAAAHRLALIAGHPDRFFRPASHPHALVNGQQSAGEGADPKDSKP